MPRAERPAVGDGFDGGGRVMYAACALSQFLVAAGASVVTTMGPALREANGLRASWLPSAVLVYVLALGLLVLPLRLLIRRTRPLPVLILGLWLFVQSSVALTLVSGAPAFLAFRAVQGVGAAALTATALALVPALDLDLDGQRPDRLLLVWSAVVVAGFGTGLAAGAVVGADWRWALWANVPLTATAGIPLVRLLRSTRRRDKGVGAGAGAGDGDGVGVGQGEEAQDAAA
ncbi:MFS transporter [Streptomyces phaeochromogenes]|uniref:MFS transporter n=1 Tax=Streptomyces phaeochromogenes TaxID=1923 RepID=UPI00224FBE14|nr:MFS transporter [Streptomyces phaeochromogenes]MCX5598119.1 MFS transporter [Streptomyces phaeochromogenes]